MFDLEKQIRGWTDYLHHRGNFLSSDIEELEGHLRDEIDGLVKAGLASDEAFLIGVKRLGETDNLSREFYKVNSDRLWKQLVLPHDDPQRQASGRFELMLVILLALAAGTLAKIPELFGRNLTTDQLFYFKNLSLFVFPMVVVYFLWKRKLTMWPYWTLLLPFAGAAVAVNLYPSYPPHHTAALIGIHLPMLLWSFVAIAYVGGRWREPQKRMDFVRFCGECFIYGVLLLCGGGVLTALIFTIFGAIRVDVTKIANEYLAIYGGLGSIVVAVFLVEAKKSIVETMAPVLARVFSPLFLLTLLSFLAVMIILGRSPYTERNFLIGFDLMLAMVVGLVLYLLSAREPDQAPGYLDWLNFALVAAALAVDAVALSAILYRISAFGFTANKVAALGENLILLVNLIGLSVLYLRFLLKRIGFPTLERLQTAYLPVYAVWAALVALGFPVLFGFI